MIDKKVLKEAIEQAKENGWDFHGMFPGLYKDADLAYDILSGLPTLSVRTEHRGRLWAMGAVPLFCVIYDHDFAKALWGYSQVGLFDNDKWYDLPIENKTWLPISILPNWQYHLQQMVIAEDPIKYLGENI